MSAPRNGGSRAWRRARARVLREQTSCARCGEPVDKSLPLRNEDGTTNLRSASVDHVTSVATGGALLAQSNLQLMHLGCNIAKGDGRPRTPSGLTTTRAW